MKKNKKDNVYVKLCKKFYMNDILKALSSGSLSLETYLNFKDVLIFIRREFKIWLFRNIYSRTDVEFEKWCKDNGVKDCDLNPIWNILGDFTETLHLHRKYIFKEFKEK